MIGKCNWCGKEISEGNSYSEVPYKGESQYYHVGCFTLSLAESRKHDKEYDEVKLERRQKKKIKEKLSELTVITDSKKKKPVDDKAAAKKERRRLRKLKREQKKAKGK